MQLAHPSDYGPWLTTALPPKTNGSLIWYTSALLVPGLEARIAVAQAGTPADVTSDLEQMGDSLEIEPAG